MKKAYKVFITKNAQDDLGHIFSYMAEDSISNDRIFVSELEKKINTLSTLPERASYIPENVFFSTDYRQLMHGKYRVIYRFDKNEIYILRVIHDSKLLEL
ncbi:MAG: type II toxin-antitoxin system RelE/ParE family toxin [Thermoleophilia bacterium]